jgi:hypothetical protein
MPKEIISTRGDSPFQPVLIWGHDTNVRLRIGAEGERSIFWTQWGQDDLSKAKFSAAIFDVLTEQCPKIATALTGLDAVQCAEALLNGLDVASSMGYLGLTADLDRKACNDLIRFVRRARDAAYGKDE